VSRALRYQLFDKAFKSSEALATAPNAPVIRTRLPRCLERPNACWTKFRPTHRQKDVPRAILSQPQFQGTGNKVQDAKLRLDTRPSNWASSKGMRLSLIRSGERMRLQPVYRPSTGRAVGTQTATSAQRADKIQPYLFIKSHGYAGTLKHVYSNLSCFTCLGTLGNLIAAADEGFQRISRCLRENLQLTASFGRLDLLHQWAICS
jgi:hypothetical protein